MGSKSGTDKWSAMAGGSESTMLNNSKPPTHTASGFTSGYSSVSSDNNASNLNIPPAVITAADRTADDDKDRIILMPAE